ncbi:cytochrome P450 [Plesiomonas shigelloides]|uniref:Cytochrome P450 n=1 Tax=Plesiomonas shigelloides 302-73 TaxID=1315976 RepID=R8AR16_PLESH|nr:cytochrome P450 [Plesiomonas shigelloides]EON88773.1 hypothetical protein PLESHI_08859 [Plesiomonas shigelloides 302-73]
MKSLWGDDTEEFRPQRWLDENDNFKAESPFKFAAFQAGLTICLGKEIRLPYLLCWISLSNLYVSLINSSTKISKNIIKKYKNMKDKKNQIYNHFEMV